ncbi:uncharacterized protein UTRI_02993 [Ustilago trichophora]|uniref:Uncharacterized protein n=1 Tax=Ustilago trichophora TaxID=86804 RepID=A0A5C3ERJ7_9BASI|nr:uncharacterized protein UTRI_02993 [Ustilago trichophora]
MVAECVAVDAGNAGNGCIDDACADAIKRLRDLRYLSTEGDGVVVGCSGKDGDEGSRIGYQRRTVLRCFVELAFAQKLTCQTNIPSPRPPMRRGLYTLVSCAWLGKSESRKLG